MGIADHTRSRKNAGDPSEDSEMPSQVNENAARGMLHAIPIAAGLWLLIAIAAFAVVG